MPKVITIYWRDIPAQVNAKDGRKRAKKLLTTRFQEAIIGFDQPFVMIGERVNQMPVTIVLFQI